MEDEEDAGPQGFEPRASGSGG